MYVFLADSDECYSYGQSKYYKDDSQETDNGSLCVDWLLYEAVSSNQNRDYVIDSNFPDGSVANASNFCRNPSDSERPWCFTTDDGDWNWCNFSICLSNY